MLRDQANTILDIRLQTMGMTDQEALDLMIKQTYQEREQATAKLQRAHYRERHPQDYPPKSFHERALNEGAVPLATLDRLLP